MKFIIGVIVVFGSVAFGYGAHGGNFAILNQPFEVVIILGAATGAFIIANPPDVLRGAGKGLKLLMGGKPFKQQDYIELLSFMYEIFKMIKTKGMLEVESHIEDPGTSSLFSKYPNFAGNHHAVDFFCDNLRMLTMGIDNQYQMEDMMSKELEIHHQEGHAIGDALNTYGESLPALGIVAAVLGVITTMTSISEPPEVLGGLIAAALVGTFLGVLLSYGLVSPMGKYLMQYFNLEGQYYECIKIGILAMMQGHAPAICVEFARKAIPGPDRPSFKDVETALESV